VLVSTPTFDLSLFNQNHTVYPICLESFCFSTSCNTNPKCMVRFAGLSKMGDECFARSVHKTLICFYMCVHNTFIFSMKVLQIFLRVYMDVDMFLCYGWPVYIYLARCDFSISSSLFCHQSVSKGRRGRECSGSLCCSLSLSACSE
jgi:hypothetical protein